MKKIIAMLLCVALVAALGVTAFAAGEEWASDVVPGSTAPKEVDKAVDDAKEGTKYAGYADDAALVAKALGDLKKLDDKFVATITSTSVSDADKDKAAAEYGKEVKSLVDAWKLVKLSDGTKTLDQADLTVGTLTVKMADYTKNDSITTVAAYQDCKVGAGVTKANKVETAAKLVAAGYQHAVTWDLSSGSQMDANTLNISNAKTDYAAAKEDAVKAAAAAKTAAAAAQAKAKTLINDAVKVAQDAAAIAVADAQTQAYTNLASAYATAVADFWADVADAISNF